jgi:toxin ParE1/3/4
MRIVWSRRALSNLIQLRQFIAQERPQAAAVGAAKILDSIEHLSLQPNVGRPGRIAGTRELVVAGTSYLVPYRIRSGRLEIIAVFHGRRKWPDRL